jgi:hypothetical protein
MEEFHHQSQDRSAELCKFLRRLDLSTVHMPLRAIDSSINGIKGYNIMLVSHVNMCVLVVCVPS